jgi:type IV pilus assembly protein PilQ
MNSLQLTSGYAKKAVIALMIISTLCLAVAAQKVDAQRQGRMYGDPGFRGEPINLNVVNADIRDILNYITEQYGVNFVIDKSVTSVPVTVNVSEVPWNIALDSILQAQGLGVQVNGTILRIADKKALAADIDIDLRAEEARTGTQTLVTEFVRLNYARAKDAIVRGTLTSGTRTEAGETYGLAPIFAGGGSAGAPAPASSGGSGGLLPIIQRRLSKRGSIEVDERSNSLIITDVRQNVDAVKQLIAILDQPEPQVEIEARIVAATRKFSRDIGIQLAALVTGPRGSGGAGSTLGGAPVDPRLKIPPSLPQAAVSGLASQLVNTAIGLTTGVFGTAQISALITAGEQKNQAKVIATPRVTTLNNRKAMIKSSTKVPVTTVQPSAGVNAIATTTYIDVPLKLEITPQITDVGTVVLDVTAENASTATIIPGVPPAINSQEMQTQVVVPDGGTTVVGGVVFDDERESQDRTPGLSRIPLFGNLFKRKGVSRDTVEILFFITPRILRPEVANVSGQSGVRTSGTVIQPVPLGNPASNSVPTPESTPAPQTVVVQPATAPQKP